MAVDIIPLGQTGVSALHPPFGHYARLPEDLAQQTRSRGHDLFEGPSAGLARAGSVRNEPLPTSRGRRLVAE